jgi:HAD superfamily hydrolase (TIGR01490 family)
LTRLVLFDLDRTLLSGDSDELWCEFLIGEGLLDRAEFGPRNADMARRYADGSVGTREFCEFYVGTLAGRTPAQWQALCRRFADRVIAPRIPAAARQLVDTHRQHGDTLVLTTATNRVITEPTAAGLGIDHLIATEVELGPDGRCTGRTRGTPNMREGKVQRLHEWLDARAQPTTVLLARATFYSDSGNDLPLLEAVAEPVAVDPDRRLRDHAHAAGWRIIEFAR